MASSLKAERAGYSRRRTLIRSVLFGAGAVASILPIRQAVAKMAQSAASYQDLPKGDQQCGNCSLFQPRTPASSSTARLVPQAGANSG